MAGEGFFETRRPRASALAAVAALHIAVLAAVLMIKTPIYVRPDRAPTIGIFIPEPPLPPPDPQPQNAPTRRSAPSAVTTTQPLAPASDDSTTAVPLGPGPIAPADPGPLIDPGPQPQPVRQPVRVAAAADPRFADSLQPLYPPVERRMEREGRVRVRVTIATGGRVRAIERLFATSEALWKATRRQALSRWRFRPAPENGRPVEDTMILTVTFRLVDA